MPADDVPATVKLLSAMQALAAQLETTVGLQHHTDVEVVGLRDTIRQLELQGFTAHLTTIGVQISSVIQRQEELENQMERIDTWMRQHDKDCFERRFNERIEKATRGRRGGAERTQWEAVSEMAKTVALLISFLLALFVYVTRGQPVADVATAGKHAPSHE